MEDRINALFEKENTCYKIADTALKDAMRDMRLLLAMQDDEYIAQHVEEIAKRIVKASEEKCKADETIQLLDWIQTGKL